MCDYWRWLNVSWRTQHQGPCLSLQYLDPFWVGEFRESSHTEQIVLHDFDVSHVVFYHLLHEFLAWWELEHLQIIVSSPHKEWFICSSTSHGCLQAFAGFSGWWWSQAPRMFISMWLMSAFLESGAWSQSSCPSSQNCIHSSRLGLIKHCDEAHNGRLDLVRGDFIMHARFPKGLSNFMCCFISGYVPLCELSNKVNAKFCCSWWFYFTSWSLICSCGSCLAPNWHWGMMWAKWISVAKNSLIASYQPWKKWERIQNNCDKTYLASMDVVRWGSLPCHWPDKGRANRRLSHLVVDSCWILTKWRKIPGCHATEAHRD